MGEASEVSEWLRAAKDTLDIFKNVRALLPSGKEADKAGAEIDRAERALQKSEAELAKALGYKLCQCTFPPQIMLSKGHHPTHGMELFKCDKCGKQEPSEHMIAQHERVKTHNEANRPRPWIDARRGR